jgi:diguanylate cyclase (GGDEF)-like protein
MNNPGKNVRKYKFQTLVFTVSFITVIILLAHFRNQNQWYETLFWWLVSTGGGVTLIYYTYYKIEKLQEKLDEQLIRSNQFSLRQTALTSLSGGFAANISEDEICTKLAKRLQAVPEYQYVAVYLLDQQTEDRVLRSVLGPKVSPTTKFIPPATTLIDQALHNGQHYYTPDVSQVQDLTTSFTHGSEIDVPIQFGDHDLGVLVVANHATNAFGNDDFAMLNTIADQAAIAIQNARLYQAEKISAEKLVVLYEASQSIISASFNPERTYTTIHEAAAHLMPCEAFSIAILDEKSVEIEAVYLVDRGGRTPAVRFSAGEGLSGHIISTGKSLIIDDFHKTNEMDDIDVKHFGSSQSIRAFIAVPMRLGSVVVGMLSAQSYHPHEYSTEDQRFLEMLAAHAAIAIDNANLFAQIQQLAITDSLTNVYNRRYFFDTARHEFTRSQRYHHQLAILMLDLDNYKAINDNLGHVAGDQILVKIARFLEENIRQIDTLGRYGGDEFSILLPETDLEHATELADRLRVAVQTTSFEFDNQTINTTVSIGITSTNQYVTELNQLLLSADAALYEAKTCGRNCIRIQEWPISNPDVSKTREWSNE